jgi:phosphotransferase system  glucose/maltose/N-acetylglucosamine-specific IIC component
MIEKVIGRYSLILGITILGSWGMILFTGEIPEGRTEFAFHLFSEVLMSLSCIVAGALILKQHRLGRGVTMAAHGMVIYSVLNAAGYYAEREGWILPAVFVILFLISSTIIVLLIKRKGVL